MSEQDDTTVENNKICAFHKGVVGDYKLLHDEMQRFHVEAVNANSMAVSANSQAVQANATAISTAQKLFEKFDEINDRLFHDNGKESIQSVQLRHELWMEGHDKTETVKLNHWQWLIPTIFAGISLLIAVYAMFRNVKGL